MDFIVSPLLYHPLSMAGRGSQLDPQSLAIQSVGVLTGGPMRRLFFRVDVVATGLGRLYVGGRVHADLIRLDDRFTACVPAMTESDGDAVREGRPVLMVVRGILLYRKYVNQVPSGMTAELELELLVDVTPKVGDALVGEAQLPPFAEYEVLGVGDFHVESV